jgi:GTP-binding protein HflX
VLVHIDLNDADYESDRAEFHDLARSAGAEIVAMIGGSRPAKSAI